MPTYEYRCTECNDKFEVFQKMNDDPLEKCKKCDGKLRKIFSPGGGVIFKGAGFYVNDYKQSSTKDKKSTDKPKKESNCGDCCKVS